MGFPLTPKSIRRSVFKFAEQQNLAHRFNRVKRLAGYDWYRSFLRRHPQLSQRKAQSMNPARAQKLNPFIVSDYFEKLGNVMDTLDIKNHPEKVYNVDEKGCRLTLHHQQTVVAQKGVKRVHLVAPEHAENVTVVACANAVGNVIPPMILFKGQRMKPTFEDGLPPGSAVQMAPKGSMTTELFIQFLHHFAKFMQPPPVLLILDGAASHLDFTIADVANSLGITLLCLPSNTTHELQPMDKSVFRSFEHFWDEELLRYWERHPERTMNKERFSEVFTPVWGKCMTIENIVSGFRATGIWPFNKNAIPVHAYAPSLATQRNNPEVRIEDEAPIATSSPVPHEGWEFEDDLPLAELCGPKKAKSENSFSEVLITPDPKPKKATRRRKAINYKAQLVTKDLFQKQQEPGPSCSNKASSQRNKNEERWYCGICQEDKLLDMRQCPVCNKWFHEECLGIEPEDQHAVACPDCENKDGPYNR